MQLQKIRDTAPEMKLRRELHRRGLRFRLHRKLLPDQRSTVDIVFPGPRVAVDVRGCFWHVRITAVEGQRTQSGGTRSYGPTWRAMLRRRNTYAPPDTSLSLYGNTRRQRVLRIVSNKP